MSPEALALCRELRNDGVSTTRESGSHLITALCEAGRTEEALKVYRDMVVAKQGGSAVTQHSESYALATTPESDLENLGGERHSVRTREAASLTSAHPSELTAAELLGLRRRVLLEDRQGSLGTFRHHQTGRSASSAYRAVRKTRRYDAA